LDLGTLGGDGSVALGINDAGDIVGISQLTPGQKYAPSRGFIFTGGVMYDISSLIKYSSGINTSTIAALAINNKGQIAAYGTDGYKYYALRLEPAVKVPLVFIPGIAGSVLSLNGIQKWPSISESDIRSLNWRTGLQGLIPTDIVRASYGKMIYGPIAIHLTGIGGQGYTEFPINNNPSNMTTGFQAVTQSLSPKPTFFPFPYDWRNSNSTQTATLHQYIANIRQLHGGAKVDIVAHSMGGLLARRYILDYGSDDINHLVTVGSPFWGAPKAIQYLLVGGFFGVGLIDAYNNAAMIETLPTLPGVHELLPSDHYLQNGGAPLISENRWDLNNNRNATEIYTPSQYKTLIDQRASPDRPSYNNDLFHNWQGGLQDNWASYSGGVSHLHICGLQKTDSTTKQVIARAGVQGSRMGEYHYYDFVKGPGDGTVPLLSAQRLAQFWAPGTQIRTISGESDVEHTALMKHPTVLSMIDAFLANQTVPASAAPAATALAAQSPAGTTVASQRITIFGMNYVGVSDSLGNTNAKISDAAASSIPDVSITYGGAEAWVDINAKNTVDLTIQGTSTDPAVEIAVTQFAADGTALSLRRYRFTPTGHLWQARMSPATTPSVTDPVVVVDTNNNSSYEVGEQIQPTQTSGTGPVDNTPPSLGLTLSTSGGGIVIAITGSDNVTASPVIRYTINDGPVQTYTGPINIAGNPNAVVKAYTEDAMGNTSGMVTTNVTPSVTMTSQQGAMGLTWPVADGYVLEESTDLATWTVSSRPISRSATSESVSILYGTTPKKFFRLRSQPVSK